MCTASAAPAGPAKIFASSRKLFAHNGLRSVGWADGGCFRCRGCAEWAFFRYRSGEITQGKWASEFKALTASLKRCPDTKQGLFSSDALIRNWSFSAICLALRKGCRSRKKEGEGKSPSPRSICEEVRTSLAVCRRWLRSTRQSGTGGRTGSWKRPFPTEC